MVSLNPVRRRVVSFLQLNAMTAWLFFSVVALGYAFSVFSSLRDSSRTTVSQADLDSLIYLSVSIGAVLLLFALVAIVCHLMNWAGANKVMKNAFLRLIMLALGAGAFCYLIVWIATYLIASSLLNYDDAPYKFLITLTMAGTMLIFAVYVVFLLFLRFRKGDKKLAEQVGNSLQAGSIDVEGAVQNIDAFNWVKKFDEKSEPALLTLLSGVGRRKSSLLWLPLFLVNLALFGVTASMIVFYGTQLPATNIANADYNITSLAPSLCWLVTVAWSHWVIEHMSCYWSLKTLTPVEKQDTAYGFLSLVYSRFYATPETAEIKKGRKTYNIYSRTVSSGPLLQLRFDGDKATVTSRSLDDFADGLSRYTVLKPEHGEGKRGSCTVETENNIYRILLLFVFASFWSVVLFGSEARR